MDKSTAIYGKSTTGKSTVIKHIMKLLNPHVPIVFVISPTEQSNQEYKGFVDTPFIHYDLTIEGSKTPFLDNLWQWQNMRASIYRKVNRIDAITSLYDIIRGMVDDSNIRKVMSEKTKAISKAPGDKATQMAEKYDEILCSVMKKSIMRNITTLNKKRSMLSIEQIYTLNYIDMNPRVLLIFDDCAAELKKHVNTPNVRKLFYQNRHSFISTVFSCQDDTDLPPNLRKNTFVSIFTTAIVASANFDRSTNKYSSDTKKYVTAMLSEVFVGFRKLLYLENDPERQHFYHFTAIKHAPFRFMDGVIDDLCQAVQVKNGTIDQNNMYYGAYKV
jgi:hypothetical protein